MNILVTGGAGYVGSILVPMLLKEGHKVRVLDNLIYNTPSLLDSCINKNFEFVKGDIRDKEIVADCLNNINYIIHLAAIVGAPACRKDKKISEDINYRGTIIVNNLREESQKIIYASTGSVYGSIEDICTEESTTKPLTTYGITKLMAEKEVMKKDNAIAFRFATGFGLSPRLRLDLLPNDFVFQVIKNKYLLLYEKDFRRTFIHVRDIAKAYIFGINNFDNLNGEIFNIGSEKLNYTKEDIALAIKNKIDYSLYYSDCGSDPDKRDYEVSYKKIRNKGFEASISLDQGLEELIKGMRMINLYNPYSNV